jgi:uncharacterized membrane protein
MMKNQTTSSKTWKTTWMTFFILGIVLPALTLIPYAQIQQTLGKFEADGTFDSLTLHSFSLIMNGLRALGCLALGAAALIYFGRTWAVPWLERAIRSLRSVSIKQDLQNLWMTIYSDRSDLAFLLGLAAITIIGLLLRLIQLNSAVGYDEAYTFLHFSARPLRYVVTDYSGPNNHIFHSILVYIAYHLFGNHVWALRLPAFLAGVLCIPTAYLAGKHLYNRWAGLLASAGVALVPMVVSYSDNARGYTLYCMFAGLGLWLAAELIRKNNATAWFLLYLTCALGFYTIPVFLYPFGVIYLWLFLSALFGETGGLTRISFLKRWFWWGIATGITVLLLYAPVILFGTGLNSIIGNKFVKSQSWAAFFPNLLARIPGVWRECLVKVPEWIIDIGVVGLGASLLLHWKSFRHKVPLALAALVWIALAVTVQRVTPLARIWMFLLVYSIIWSAAGVTALIQWAAVKIPFPIWTRYVLILALVAGTFGGYWVHQRDPEYSQIAMGMDEEAAIYLKANLTKQESIVAVAPISIRVGYYLYQMGVPYSRYYDRDRPTPISQGLVIVQLKTKYPTVDSILAFQRLDKQFDAAQATLVYTQNKVEIYSISAMP